MLSLVLALVFGMFAAGALEDGGGFPLGAGLGWLTGVLIGARQRLKKVEQAQHELLLELRTYRLEMAQQAREPSAPRAEAASGVEAAPPAASAASAARADPRASTTAAGPAAEPSAPRAPEPAPYAPAPAAEPDAFDLFFARLSSLMFGGNTIVRAGVLVLLVGIALLLRWAAEHSVFPLELRLMAAAVLAIALVVVGYRQREARPGFGQSLQGAGVAALYLVVFFAFRHYQLLPAGLAFGLLAAIALSSGVLAVVQDALALIVIGQVGGFMAPVLAASGEGNHVALFSYYLLLNLLIFALSWFRPWRALNLIGFAFTFGIGSTWGALRYRPELFASTEPFLIAFFLLYSLIPVSYALRGCVLLARGTARVDEHERGWVDASLLFGTPLAVLLLQYALVKDVPFGMAYSTLALAASTCCSAAPSIATRARAYRR